MSGKIRLQDRLRFWLTTTALVGSTLVALTTPAQADPISLAVGLLAGGLAAAGGASTLIATIVGVATVGLSYIAKSLLPNAGDSVAKASQKMQSGGIVPQSFPFGPICIPGSLVYFNEWGKVSGTPNAYLVRVVALSDIPIQGLTSIIVAGTAATYGSGTIDPTGMGYPIPEYDDAHGNHYMWIKFYDGTQTVVDPYLRAKFGSDTERPYGANRVGKGRAYAIVTTRYNADLFSGVPEVKFVTQGAKLYNVRKDSTAGGTGAHRSSTPSTWEYTENPQQVRHHIRRGIYYNGKWFYGLQNMSAARLPFDNWSAAMNDCDTLVNKSPSGTEKQYRCGGEITVNTEPASFDESLLRACNARSIEIGGVYKTTTGAIGAPVASYTDDDLIVTEPQSYEQYPGLGGTVNGITASFPDPSQAWATIAAPALMDAVLKAEDGGRELVANIDYDCVPFAQQVQRLMSSALKEERRWRTHTGTLPHTEWQREPGDAISWTSTDWGYVDKIFRVESVKLLRNRDIQITIREADPADYDWDIADVQDVSTGTLIPRPPASQAIVGWSVSNEIIYGDDGRAKAGFRINWETDDVDDVNGVIYQVRRVSDHATILAGETDHFEDGTLATSTNISSATDYEARGKYRPASDRQTDWSSWLPFTTDDVRIGAIDIGAGAITITAFASGLTAVEIVATLPTVGNFDGRTVFLTTDKKLYRYDGTAGAFIASVATVDLTGTITSSQIAAGAVTITKFASGITPVEIVGTLPTTGNFDGRQVFLTTDKKLYRYSATASAFIASVATTDLTGTISSAQIAANAVTIAKFASGITPVEILSSNPGSGNFDGRMVFNTTDKKLYRYDGTAGAFKTSVATVDLTGTITSAQIAAGAVTLTAFASGITPVEVVATLPSTGNFDGRVVALTTDGKLYRYYSGSWTVAIAAADISGTLSTSNIPNLDTSKITTGTFNSAFIAAGAITTTKFASGITPVEIFASNPGSGNFDGRMVFNTTDKKLYRYDGTAGAFKSTTATSDLTGTIIGAQIAAATVATSNLAPGAVTAPILSVSIGGGNLVGNSSFEFSTNGTRPDGYIAYNNGSIAFTYFRPAGRLAGYAFGIRAGASTSAQFGLYGSASPGDIINGGVLSGWKPNTAYMASFYARKLNGAGWTTTDLFWNLGPTTVWLSQPNLSTSYQRYIARLTTGASPETGGQIYISIVGNTVSGDEIWIDDLQIEEGDTVTAYAPITSEILPLTVTGTQIANNTITAGNIVASTITATEIAAGSITSAKIAAATILASNIAASTITGSNIAASTITGSLIAATTITASNLAVGSVTASKLLIAASNLIFDPLFQDPNWWTSAGTTPITISTDATAAAATHAASMAAFSPTGSGGGNTTFISSVFPAEANATYRLSVASYVTAGFTGLQQIGIQWRDYLQNQISTVSIAINDYRTVAAASATTVVAQQLFTAPATAAFAWIRILGGRSSTLTNAGQGYWGLPALTRATDGNLVVAGSITGTAIAASTITGSNIAASTITAANIAANTITASQIAADTITSGQIAVAAITASELAAGAVTASKITIAAENLIADPLFGDAAYWTLFSGAVFSTDSAAVAALGFSPVLKTNLVGVGPSISIYGAPPNIPVEAGAAYKFRVTAYHTTGFTGLLTLYNNWLDRTGSIISVAQFNGVNYNTVAAGSAGTETIAGFAQAPAGAVYLQVAVLCASSATLTNAGVGYLAYPSVTRAADGNLIVSGSIVAAHIAASTITSAQIAAGTITGGNIAGTTITASNIAADTITAAQIAAGAVNTSELAANAVTAAKITAGTITATEIAGSTITGSNIAANTITASNIAADTITAGEIAAGAINTSELAALAVTAAKIAAATITASQIAAATITTTQIAASTITGGNIAGTTITASNIAADTITAGQIAAGAVNTSELAANAVTAAKLAIGPIGLTVVGLVFKPNDPIANQTSWSAGAIGYIDSTGTVATASISAGNTGTWSSGSIFIYFAPTVSTTVLQTTTVTATAFAAGNTVLAWYAGGIALDATYGRSYIDGSGINALSITAAQITAATITGAKIAGTTITAANIAANTITASQIAANTITAGQIQAGAISATEIASNAITTGKIATGAINAGTMIVSNLIVTGHLAANAVTQGGGYLVTQQVATVTATTAIVNSFTLQTAALCVCMADGVLSSGIATTSTDGSIEIEFTGQLTSTSGATTIVTFHIDYSTNGGSSWTNCPGAESVYRLSSTPLSLTFHVSGIAPTGTNRIRVTGQTSAVDVTIACASVDYTVFHR